MKEIRKITVFALMISVFTVGCEKKKDDKTLLYGAAALSASRSTTTAASTYTIGGTVSDLWTSGLVLQNNAGDDATVTANLGAAATFTFATKVTGAYAVTVKTQPTAATCTVTKGSGTASANVTDVSISCVTNVGGGILKLLSSLTTVVSVFVGPAAGTTTAGTTDATGTAARFSTPYDITTDGTSLYVADQSNHRIRKIVISTGVVTTLAGSTFGYTDGTGTAAQFNNPQGVTTDGTNVYVSDTSNNRIRKIVISTGVVTTLAGSGTAASVDGTGTAAQFNGPQGLTTDGSNLYVAESTGNKIRKIVISTGVVTTLAGSGTAASVDGTGTAAQFNTPFGITTDITNLYVTDLNGNKVRKIVISTGVVTTLAGSTLGNTDGTGTAAQLNNPAGIVTDGTNLYLSDNGSRRIRKIVITTGVVTTLAGSSTGDVDGTGTAARFNINNGITTDGTSLYVADAGNNKIRKIQ